MEAKENCKIYGTESKLEKHGKAENSTREVFRNTLKKECLKKEGKRKCKEYCNESSDKTETKIMNRMKARKWHQENKVMKWSLQKGGKGKAMIKVCLEKDGEKM